MRKEPPQTVAPTEKVAPTSRSAVVRVSRPALTSVALLTLAFPVALPAQSIQTISPQQCVWRIGDNPAWATPTLDETGWEPYTQWKLNPDQPRIWVRCHADLSALRGTAHPALQVSLPAAYELYGNGQPIGGAGNRGQRQRGSGIGTLRTWSWTGRRGDRFRLAHSSHLQAVQ